MNSITVYPLRVTAGSMINYCYLIVNLQTKTAVIVDPAWELDTIEQKLLNLNVKLQGILLTHYHFDHVNLAAPLAIKYQVPVFMARAEIDYYNFQCPYLNAIENFTVFTLGAIVVTPIFTPGHTFGGTSYLIANNLFCGDTLFIEGCGLCTGKGADPNKMFNTLQHLKAFISLHIHIYPGHCYGKPVGQTFEFVCKNNLYLQLNDKDEFIAFRMRKLQKGLFDFK